MTTQPIPRFTFTVYLMMFISLLLIAGTILYLSHSSPPGNNIITLNGPWKFILKDSLQYADPGYDDAAWNSLDLTAPASAHDGDVGLSGYIPGWTSKGYAGQSGFAWYRLQLVSDSIKGNNLAIAAPPAVDDAYQLFVNGSLLGQAGDFSERIPTAYSIQPRMFSLPASVNKYRRITIAFRVWMGTASLYPGAGGIHIAPALGETTDIAKKYHYQWEQTIKGYIVEVVWPVLFFLLAAGMFWAHRFNQHIPPYHWFVTALILLGLVRCNQALTAWFQILSNHQSAILGIIILRPLMLGAWLMAWREWFRLQRPKWLPLVIAVLTVLYMATQTLALVFHNNAHIHTYLQRAGDYTRLLMLATMLFILYLGIRLKNRQYVLSLVTMLLLIIAIFPNEISALGIIPGIWFPYGVGVTRGQFIYPVFVLLMYILLLYKTRQFSCTYNTNK